MEKKLPPGSRMPSLRKCSQELKLSRTTIENAYLQLAAEGYIISKAQSGYYVTDIADRQHTSVRKTEKHAQTPCRFDFASSGVDRESFRLTFGDVISKALFARMKDYCLMESLRVRLT